MAVRTTDEQELLSGEVTSALGGERHQFYPDVQRRSMIFLAT